MSEAESETALAMRLGQKAGWEAACMAASSAIQKMARERGRSDVNANSAAAAILMLATKESQP